MNGRAPKAGPPSALASHCLLVRKPRPKCLIAGHEPASSTARKSTTSRGTSSTPAVTMPKKARSPRLRAPVLRRTGGSISTADGTDDGETVLIALLHHDRVDLRLVGLDD